MNICNIRRTFVELRPKRGWKTIYWLVDVHGVIIPGSWHRQNEFQYTHPNAPEVLRWISNREDQRLILWTSSYKTEIDALVKWLKEFSDIQVDYVNENPLEEHTAYADFSKKFYFNILIDDKSGFEPEKDWSAVKQELIDIGEWDKI